MAERCEVIVENEYMRLKKETERMATHQLLSCRVHVQRGDASEDARGAREENVHVLEEKAGGELLEVEGAGDLVGARRALAEIDAALNKGARESVGDGRVARLGSGDCERH